MIRADRNLRSVLLEYMRFSVRITLDSLDGVDARYGFVTKALPATPPLPCQLIQQKPHLTSLLNADQIRAATDQQRFGRAKHKATLTALQIHKGNFDGRRSFRTN